MTDDIIVSPMCVQPRSVPKHPTGVAAFVKLARVVTIALAVIAGVLLTPRFAAAAEDPADFIRILGNQALAVIRSSATLDQKTTYFHQIAPPGFRP